MFISDITGQDIRAHENKQERPISQKIPMGLTRSLAMKTINVTFSILENINTLLPSLVEKREKQSL